MTPGSCVSGTAALMAFKRVAMIWGAVGVVGMAERPEAGLVSSPGLQQRRPARQDVHQLTPAFGQADQRAHRGALRLQRRKALWMTHQKVQSQLGIRGTVLSTAGREGLAILSEAKIMLGIGPTDTDIGGKWQRP